MLIKFTGFNPLHPTDAEQVVEIESKEVTSVVSSITGDRHEYSTITAGGSQYMVKETVAEILDALDAIT